MNRPTGPRQSSPGATLRLVLALAAGVAGTAWGQGTAPRAGRPAGASAGPLAVAAGRVVLPQPRDTVPVPGVRVMLHRVGRAVQGPIDSTTAGAGGRFRFRFRTDTSALYLLSARYGGIEYFSPPVHTGVGAADTALQLVVFDTSSTAPVEAAARHIVVPRPGADGTRSVLDLIVLRNTGRLARVAPDSSHPSWRMVLPAGTGDMEVGEGDVSPDAIARAGDTVKVLAPLSPGEKQISLDYTVLPVRGRIVFPVGPDSGEVNLLVEERDGRVTGGTLALADSQQIEGRSFLRYHGTVPRGGAVVLALGGPDASDRWALPALVAGVALTLAAAAWVLLRRAPRPALAPAGPVAPSRDTLLDAIAALDARHAGREAERTGEEWGQYRAERERLKRELERTLAAGGRPPYS